MRVSGVDSSRGLMKLKGFEGLNNKVDPMRGIPGSQGVAPKTWGLLKQADNIDLTDSGGAVVRDGYVAFLVGTRITGAFSTFDYSRLFIIDNGVLKRVNADGSIVQLATGVTGTPHWAELNDVVYLSCDVKLEIHPGDKVLPWGVPTPAGGHLTQSSGRLEPGNYRVCFTFIDQEGKEGGASPFIETHVSDGALVINDIPRQEGYHTLIYLSGKSPVFHFMVAVSSAFEGAYTYTGYPLGRELTNQFLDQPPAGATYIAGFKGQLYAAEHLPDANATAIWYSEPLGYHLFNYNDSYFMVPGKVVQMGANDDALMLSTEDRTFLYDQNGLSQVAEYGSVPGQHTDLGPDGKLYFWTKRGLCRIAPFENLTESDVSVAPGVRAAGGVVQRHGYKQFVVALQSGGSPFNKR